jgi:ubiquinone biosynthesis monooxygenase Coq7
LPTPYSETITHKIPALLNSELRASHAGETGAVWIYRGALTADFIKGLFKRKNNKSAADKGINAFALHHLETEKQHLHIFENEMPFFRGSFILLLWIAAGFLTGFIPRLIGKDWFYYTIYCVEYFVDEHYEHQISAIQQHGGAPKKVLTLMRSMQGDEQDHRDEARANMQHPPSFLMKCWGEMIGKGSAAAVSIAKRI